MQTIGNHFTLIKPVTGRKLIGLDLFSGIDSSPPKETTKNYLFPRQDSASLLRWPETGRCSYFTGGDGNAELAVGGILSFIRDKCDITKLPEGSGFNVMKMDHHGSSAETFFKKIGVARVSLEELPMTQFRPRNIIVTPGSRHGHPNAIQFLKYLIKPVINRGDNDSDPMKPVGRLFGTKTPYWAVKSSPGKKDINFKHHENTSIIRSKELIRFIGKGHFDAGTGNSTEAISQVFTSEILWILDYWAGQIEIELDMLVRLQQTPPKPESKKIGQELKEETEEIRISLLDYLVADFENRRNIQFMGRESWNELSAQTIQESLLGVVPPKTAYFLIRFTFIDGTPRTVCWVDQLETGVLINSIRILWKPVLIVNRICLPKTATTVRLMRKATRMKITEKTMRRKLVRGYVNFSGKGMSLVLMSNG
ncbi:uncharacterized protein FOBCDRAFT_200911 [Fusarium oxysporum Fo47]|uniref:uncharacterized protein n=1 Tax=Fusarium oxysporum Fo47 TaxID=660027 RepID=UPI002869AC77|nr:uncharacterized protein FOBCDRAFT_200911 [Fusarium oxysporum Fo47]WJG35227.1 hypothetical protein FOBCDRAFT_200911 [Fusarium oxysporum Fo47]